MMGNIKKAYNILCNKKKRFLLLSNIGFYNWMDDKKYLEKRFELLIGEKLDLENPKTFNEKMQWLKLYDRKKVYSKMADKYEAKRIVEKKVGAKYVIPTIGVYNKFDEIDFNKLPKRFVIKCTHDSGGVVICLDKNSFDVVAAKKKLEKKMQKNYFYDKREWPYKDIRPRILVEEYVKDDLIEDLRDYKFMCFNGEPKYVYITVKNDNIFENYYDMDFKVVDINHGFPRSRVEFKKPKLFNEMKDIARRLSRDTPFLRVDLHYVNGKILFGEMTFYDWAGFRPFVSEDIDKKLGDFIDLDSVKIM